MPARSRADILSTRLVFAPTVHGSAWPNGLLRQTLRITAFQCQEFRCAQALRWNTITSFAAVEHKSLRQHRYGGVGKNGFYRPGSINELRPICFLLDRNLRTATLRRTHRAMVSVFVGQTRRRWQGFLAPRFVSTPCPLPCK